MVVRGNRALLGSHLGIDPAGNAPLLVGKLVVGLLLQAIQLLRQLVQLYIRGSRFSLIEKQQSVTVLFDQNSNIQNDSFSSNLNKKPANLDFPLIQSGNIFVY